MSDFEYSNVFDESVEDEGEDPESSDIFAGEDDHHHTQVRLGVDETVVAQAAAEVPEHPTIKALLDRAIRLHLLMGDKDAIVADFLSDIISDLHVLILEIQRDPSALVMSTLGFQCDDHALTLVHHLRDLLNEREQQILGDHLLNTIPDLTEERASALAYIEYLQKLLRERKQQIQSM